MNPKIVHQDWVIFERLGNVTKDHTNVQKWSQFAKPTPLTALVAGTRVKLGKQLQLCRMQNYWTVDELAEKVGVEREVVRAFENGVQIPCTFILQKLQDLFKTDFAHCQA
tara:strand:+ start:16282 stop:16611 length:330 start_codon:yes stop_codon:yes gene_type:complete